MEFEVIIEIPKGLRNKYEPGKNVEAASWVGEAAAYRTIEECRERERSAGHGSRLPKEVDTR